MGFFSHTDLFQNIELQNFLKSKYMWVNVSINALYKCIHINAESCIRGEEKQLNLTT